MRPWPVKYATRVHKRVHSFEKKNDLFHYTPHKLSPPTASIKNIYLPKQPLTKKKKRSIQEKQTINNRYKTKFFLFSIKILISEVSWKS